MRRMWVALLLAAACGDRDPATKTAAPRQAQPKPEDKEEAGIPDHVVYDQVLIAFKGSYKDADTDRPREAARALAERVFELARSGSDFTALKQEYTDWRRKDGEPYPPIQAARDGVRKGDYEIYRSTLYPGTAFVIFRLKVGEVGLVEQDPKTCPDGWFVIKRLQ